MDPIPLPHVLWFVKAAALAWAMMICDWCDDLGRMMMVSNPNAF